MNADEAIQKMVSPRDRRPTVWSGGVLQVWITRACDLSCFGCTQGSNLGGRPGMITVDQFEDACASLQSYFGVVGLFGGNPCLHPKFDQLCEIFRRYVPRARRGLWSNNLNGHGAACRATFNSSVSNLNVHLSQAAYDEMKRDWPECHPVGLESDSRHSPPFVALQDVVPDEGDRWRLVSECDVNRYWSALIGVFRGQLRGWFCELAGAQAMLHQDDPDYPDTGLPVVPGWWDRPIQDFECQIRHHCMACGIPLRGFGELAVGGTREQVSKTHLPIYRPKQRGRPVELVERREQLREASEVRATDYIQKAGIE